MVGGAGGGFAAIVLLLSPSLLHQPTPSAINASQPTADFLAIPPSPPKQIKARKGGSVESVREASATLFIAIRETLSYPPDRLR